MSFYTITILTEIIKTIHFIRKHIKLNCRKSRRQLISYHSVLTLKFENILYSQDRLNGLTVLSIHRGISLTAADEVVDE